MGNGAIWSIMRGMAGADWLGGGVRRGFIWLAGVRGMRPISEAPVDACAVAPPPPRAGTWLVFSTFYRLFPLFPLLPFFFWLFFLSFFWSFLSFSNVMFIFGLIGSWKLDQVTRRKSIQFQSLARSRDLPRISSTIASFLLPPSSPSPSPPVSLSEASCKNLKKKKKKKSWKSQSITAGFCKNPSGGNLTILADPDDGKQSPESPARSGADPPGGRILKNPWRIFQESPDRGILMGDPGAGFSTTEWESKSWYIKVNLKSFRQAIMSMLNQLR